MLRPMIVTVAQDPFQLMVTGRDVDRGIDAEPTGGLPGEHVIGNLTFEQAAVLFGPYGTLVSREGVEDRVVSDKGPSGTGEKTSTRTVVVLLGFLVAGLVLSGVPTSAQLRQPIAQLTATVEQQVIQPGQTVTIELRVELPENMHVQSDEPRDPFVIPTLLTFTLPEGVTVEEITYPAPTDFLLAGQKEPLAVFEHEFTIAVRLALAADVSPGEMVVPGLFLYQACDDRVCFAPATAAVEWHVHVEPEEHD